MENGNKKIVSTNTAKSISVGNTKVYKRIILSDDSDSDFEDNGRKSFKRLLPVDHIDRDETIGKPSSSKRVKTMQLVVPSDESDCEIVDYESVSSKSENVKFDKNGSSDYDVEDSSKSADEAFNINDDDFNDIEPVILGTDTKRNEDIIVHPKIAQKLFPHQIDGIKFMFERCYNDLNVKRKYSRQDHGCILAHCMGLGKTMQLISLLHTAISYPQLCTNKILIICPKSTILNWKAEIDKWKIKDGRQMKVFTFPDSPSIKQKIGILEKWSKLNSESDDAGVLLLGYDAFMRFVFFKSSTMKAAEAEKIRERISHCLLQPGADLVVLDEGHKIKNLKSKSSLAVNQIKTKRRIILTGTPMQNNLNEYYSMVDFIKPNFLGSMRDFAEDYANPIKNGQHKDSSRLEVRVMMEKSYVLHKKLSRFVQRRDVTVLKEMLEEKFEYDIFIPMTEIQNELYEYYLRKNPLKDGVKLLPDYQVFRKIWTHPKVLETAYIAACAAGRKLKKAKPKTCSGDESSESEMNAKDENGTEKELRMFSPLHEWWRSHVTEEQRNRISSGSKIKILFEILNMCEQEGQKCLVFSEFTTVLDVVEEMMKQITEHIKAGIPFDGLETSGSKWERAWDYCRLDGSTSQSDRQKMIDRFNQPNEKRMRVFLISSKAGGQGINLTGATRVVLLDTSWNPSNDQQSIFRVFRLGQKQKCYIYRLLAMGTMEEKVYSRSVTKQATSYRVVDKQQTERHYSLAELEELYTLTKPNPAERVVPNMPSDNVLKKLLLHCPETVFKYHEHHSLLEKEDDLTENEKEEAWKKYEREAKVQEANLQQEYDMKISQETPPFLDLEKTFDQNDSFWDEFNGNDSAKELPGPLMPRQIPWINPSTANPPLSMTFALPIQKEPMKNTNENISESPQITADDLEMTVSPSLLKDVPSHTTHSSVPRADPNHSNETAATAQKRKFKDIDIRDMLTSTPVTPPSKKSKMSLSSSKAHVPTAVRGFGWLPNQQANPNQASTSNLKVSDEIIVLDD